MLGKFRRTDNHSKVNNRVLVQRRKWESKWECRKNTRRQSTGVQILAESISPVSLGKQLNLLS